MPRYDQVYRRLAEKAVAQGGLSLKTFIESMAATGVSLERTEALLLQDLENNGPIFGKFMRDLAGAATATVSAAGRQGEIAGKISSDAELQRTLNLADTPGALQRVVTEADPEALEELEAGIADRVPYTWICKFVNTCHLCLPLHQVTLLLADWHEQGLHPDTIHAQQGWTSECQCSLIPSEEAASDDLKAPLVRLKESKAKTVTGLKTSKRTTRSVLQKDIDRAIEARDKAMGSLEGRRTLRVAGQLQKKE